MFTLPVLYFLSQLHSTAKHGKKGKFFQNMFETVRVCGLRITIGYDYSNHMKVLTDRDVVLYLFQMHFTIIFYLAF